MTFNEKVAAATGEWAHPHLPVVVAVDGSERNRSAIAWAANEAAAEHCDLALVTVTEDHRLPPPHLLARDHDQRAHDVLTDARHQVRHVVDDEHILTEVIEGPAVDALVRRAEDARMLVLGKRGLGTFARVIVGSTSIAVAGRSPVPVVIVPDKWKPADHHDGPIVVGIDPYDPHHTPIHLAFSRAKRLGAPLVAVHGWETPTAYSWEAVGVAGAVAEWEKESNAEFDKVLAGWKKHFPDVDLRAVHRHAHPAMALLDAAEDAQLVIVGRHVDGRLGGFAFGSVARAVLHYSECPVAVVPSDEDARR